MFFYRINRWNHGPLSDLYGQLYFWGKGDGQKVETGFLVSHISRTSTVVWPYSLQNTVGLLPLELLLQIWPGHSCSTRKQVFHFLPLKLFKRMEVSSSTIRNCSECGDLYSSKSIPWELEFGYTFQAPYRQLAQFVLWFRVVLHLITAWELRDTVWQKAAGSTTLGRRYGLGHIIYSTLQLYKDGL